MVIEKQSGSKLAREWADLLPRLNIAGMTSAVAANCVLSKKSENSWVFDLDPEHESMVNSELLSRLLFSINEALGINLDDVAICCKKSDYLSPAELLELSYLSRSKVLEQGKNAIATGNMFVTAMLVTPILAKSWMALNIGNRPLNRPTVERYKKDLRQGAWAKTHQGIGFDKKGNLADGQHRLVAIIESGMPIEMVVAWGVDRSGIDRQKPRSQVDEIAYAEMSDWITTKHVQIANAMMEISQSYKSSERTTTELVAFCEVYKREIVFTADIFKKNVRGVSAAIVKGTIAIASLHEDLERISQFVDVLYSGLPETKADHMALRARDFIMSGGASGGGSARIRASKTLMRAIYLFCKGQSLSRLVTPSEFIYEI